MMPGPNKADEERKKYRKTERQENQNWQRKTKAEIVRISLTGCCEGVQQHLIKIGKFRNAAGHGWLARSGDEESVQDLHTGLTWRVISQQKSAKLHIIPPAL